MTMKARIEAFLDAIDAHLLPRAEGEHLDIFHIGRSAMVWAYNHAVT